MKYRKKPIVIEAMLWKGTRGSFVSIVTFMGNKNIGVSRDFKLLDIKTLEGNMLANIGDYIIKGVKGEFYPCKPDIFEKTYELVE